jgi:hypothetical protein
MYKSFLHYLISPKKITLEYFNILIFGESGKTQNLILKLYLIISVLLQRVVASRF